MVCSNGDIPHCLGPDGGAICGNMVSFVHRGLVRLYLEIPYRIFPDSEAPYGSHLRLAPPPKVAIPPEPVVVGLLSAVPAGSTVKVIVVEATLLLPVPSTARR